MKLAAGSVRILIVDDEPLLVRINQRRLEAHGYQVTASTDSREALKKIRNDPGRVDIIITDHAMPGLTGIELSKAVLAMESPIPIIMCTGYSDTVSEKEALAMGIRKYVHKPLHNSELLDAVREIIME